jgi:hypothetical protein
MDQQLKYTVFILCFVSLTSFVDGYKVTTTMLPVINQYRTRNALRTLSLNATLEVIASQWVNQCPTTPKSHAYLLYVASGDDGIYIPKMINNAIVSWANSEIANKQLTWIKTESTGCVVSICSNSTLLACVFAPPFDV